jgi:hypothetical protein
VLRLWECELFIFQYHVLSTIDKLITDNALTKNPSASPFVPFTHPKGWTEGAAGWVLCDGCENVVCPVCTTSLGLLVSDLFYCPPCSGSGQSAAATVGGAVATAVAACAELEALPLSFKAVQRILSNLSKNPDEVKYRRLRLENPAVRKYVDLDPVLRILTSIGFVRTEEERSVDNGPSSDKSKPPVEQVLVLEGDVDECQINELLEILDGLSPESGDNAEQVDGKKNGSCDSAPGISSGEKKNESNAGEGGISDKDDTMNPGKRSPEVDAVTQSLQVALNDVGEPSAKKRKET